MFELANDQFLIPSGYPDARRLNWKKFFPLFPYVPIAVEEFRRQFPIACIMNGEGGDRIAILVILARGQTDVRTIQMKVWKIGVES